MDRRGSSKGSQSFKQTSTHEQQTPVAGSDVTVIGGGLAGMAACIHLAKAGLRVLCVDAGRNRKRRGWRVAGLVRTRLVRRALA